MIMLFPYQEHGLLRLIFRVGDRAKMNLTTKLACPIRKYKKQITILKKGGKLWKAPSNCAYLAPDRAVYLLGVSEI